jgi:hypothetical protein
MRAVTLDEAKHQIIQEPTVADNDDALLSEIAAFEDRLYDAMVRGDSIALPPCSTRA